MARAPDKVGQGKFVQDEGKFDAERMRELGV